MTETNRNPRGDRTSSVPRDSATGDHAAVGDHGASVPDRDERRTDRDDRIVDHTTRDTFIGTDAPTHRHSNVSWGAIFAGVVTFVALMFVFGLVSLGLGLEEVGGMAVGIWSAVALIIALGIAGFVSGMLSIRAGFLHGIATWATSLVAILVLVGWLGASALGALGGAIGNVAQSALEQTEISTEDLGAAAEDANVDEEQLNQAQQEVEGTAQEAQDNVAASAWWAVAGLLVGAIVAGLAGAGGARSVHTEHERRRTLMHER